MTQRQVKAAVLLIGDELLSGRTQDVNLQTIAKYLAPLGVQVAEVRVVADVPEEIVAAVNARTCPDENHRSPNASSIFEQD
jgi:molybdopterin-biosynthesis enzyme MoeA-like protein